jgi:2-succinyl-6-hydroxy-2,4-cyclohexadiene-1-carboxylate synthase
MKIDVHCLHGTFQTPDVWDGFAHLLAARLPGFGPRIRADDVLGVGTGGPAEWARAYCVSASVPTPAPVPRPARVLVGYSLGGRLGLHALLACPDRFDAAVLVSAHPGDDSSEEREQVRVRDGKWAARCRVDEWEGLLEDWDGQAVFGGLPNRAPRARAPRSLERWAEAFERFSRAEQPDLRPVLAGARLPAVLYVTGALDARYGAIGNELARRVPRIRHTTIAGAGHRVPWDRPEAFATAVADFLRVTLPAARRDGGE